MFAIIFIALLSITHSQGMVGFWNNTPWNKLPAESGVKKTCNQKLSEDGNVYQHELANTCESLKNFILGQKVSADKEVDGMPNFRENIESSNNPLMKSFFIDQQINMYVNAIALMSVLLITEPEKQEAYLQSFTAQRLEQDKNILTKEFLKNNK